MLTLRGLMSRDPFTLEPEATLREALSVRIAEGVSGAPVVTAGDRLVGVVCASDILGFEDATPPVPSRREDRQEWGDRGPPDRWLEDLSEPPAAYFRVMWDEAGSDLVERLGEPESPEWDILSQHPVAEAMTRTVVTLPPDADVTARPPEGSRRRAPSGSARPSDLVSHTRYIAHVDPRDRGSLSCA